MKRLFILFVLLGSPLGAEEAEVTKTLRPASQRFAERDTRAVPDFQRHVVPLLGRLGCNSAKCHGSFQGQGNLRLSLFGFDFQSDHRALRADSHSESGPRLRPGDPENSLIVMKATEQTDHEGGQRFATGTWEHRLLLRWIESGATGPVLKGAHKQASAVAGNPPARESEQSADALFRERIQPIFEDHCYECHGFRSSKGNFSLSNREALLAGGDTGPAVVPGNANASLLMKAIEFRDDGLQMPPSGKLPSESIAVLKQWIDSGASWPDAVDSSPHATNQELVALHCQPSEILFREAGQEVQLKIIAEWKDGTREDVTCLCRFQTNEGEIVRVGSNGLATSTGEGDTHVIALYDNGVAAIPVLRPLAPMAQPNHQAAEGPRANGVHPIDGFVNAKLGKLGLVASEPCTDAEFLRRVSIDLTGTLPAPDEVLQFLNDQSKDKRLLKIEELLERPSYAAWWTNKLCDFTGCHPKSISSLLEVAREDGYVKASQWYEWIYQRVQQNQPYDQVVAGLMLADLSGRSGSMPSFWTRQSLEEPKDTAMSVAHAFLGIQLQCAECHKHPFDQWTQADFNDFSRFFDSVTRTKTRSVTEEVMTLGLLRSGQVKLAVGDDPRKPIMDWMQDPDNPWFARAFVNRVWAGYFHRGIVEPPDQFTPANPPSHPQLLDWLSREFVNNGYDMKWLHRQIASSQTYQRSWRPTESNRNDHRNFSRAIPRRIPAEVVYDGIKQVTAAPEDQGEVRANLRRRASGHLSMRMAGTHAMKVFGKPDRSIVCDCERVNQPTLLQAIFTQNDPLMRMRLADSGWLIEIEDAEEAEARLDTGLLIQQVWLRTVGRMPSQADRARAKKHLSESPTIAEGMADLLWAMMNSKEFLLNH